MDRKSHSPTTGGIDRARPVIENGINPVWAQVAHVVRCDLEREIRCFTGGQAIPTIFKESLGSPDLAPELGSRGELHPVVQSQPCDPGKVPLVVRHQAIAEGDGGRSDHKVEVVEATAGSLTP